MMTGSQTNLENQIRKSGIEHSVFPSFRKAELCAKNKSLNMGIESPYSEQNMTELETYKISKDLTEILNNIKHEQ